MKVKRYDLDVEAWSSAQMTEEEDGEYVDFADYDALLTLARRLRNVVIALNMGAKGVDVASVLYDAKWLEE